MEPYACFYLNDNPNDLHGWERAADIVSTLHVFNEAYPESAIAGIDGDQEPEMITKDYVEMNKAMKERRSELGAHLQIGAAFKPAWLRRPYKDGYMIGAALGSLDGGMMMAYSSDPVISTSLGDKVLGFATQAKQHVSIAVEVNWRAPHTDSLWELTSSDQTAFFDMIADMDMHYRGSQNSAAYSDIVIHDYEGFFKAMYSVTAPAFIGEAVTSLYLN